LLQYTFRKIHIDRLHSSLGRVFRGKINGTGNFPFEYRNGEPAHTYVVAVVLVLVIVRWYRYYDVYGVRARGEMLSHWGQLYVLYVEISTTRVRVLLNMFASQ
jgi:hypothetical protein